MTTAVLTTVCLLVPDHYHFDHLKNWVFHKIAKQHPLTPDAFRANRGLVMQDDDHCIYRPIVVIDATSSCIMTQSYSYPEACADVPKEHTLSYKTQKWMVEKNKENPDREFLKEGIVSFRTSLSSSERECKKQRNMIEDTFYFMPGRVASYSDPVPPPVDVHDIHSTIQEIAAAYHCTTVFLLMDSCLPVHRNTALDVMLYSNALYYPKEDAYVEDCVEGRHFHLECLDRRVRDLRTFIEENKKAVTEGETVADEDAECFVLDTFGYY